MRLVSQERLMVNQIEHQKISLQKTKSRLLKIPILQVIANTIQESGITMSGKGRGSGLLRNYIHISAAFGADCGFWIFLTVYKSAECAAEFCW